MKRREAIKNLSLGIGYVVSAPAVLGILESCSGGESAPSWETRATTLPVWGTRVGLTTVTSPTPRTIFEATIWTGPRLSSPMGSGAVPARIKRPVSRRFRFMGPWCGVGTPLSRA